MATGGNDGTVRLWDLPRRRMAAFLPARGPVTSVTVRGPWVVGASAENLQVWHWPEERQLWRRALPKWRAADPPVVALHPTGAALVVAQGRRVHLVDLRRGKLSLTSRVSDSCVGAVWDPAGERLLLWNATHVTLWDAQAGQLVMRWTAPQRLSACQWLSSSSVLFGTERGPLLLWQPGQSQRVEGGTDTEREGGIVCEGNVHTARVKALATMPSKPLVVSAAASGQLQLWLWEEEASQLTPLTSFNTSTRLTCVACTVYTETLAVKEETATSVEEDRKEPVLPISKARVSIQVDGVELVAQQGVSPTILLPVKKEEDEEQEEPSQEPKKKKKSKKRVTVKEDEIEIKEETETKEKKKSTKKKTEKETKKETKRKRTRESPGKPKKKKSE